MINCVKGLIANVFTFVDASEMISKISLWNERDKAIKDGQDKLNNSNIKIIARTKMRIMAVRARKNIGMLTNVMCSMHE